MYGNACKFCPKEIHDDNFRRPPQPVSLVAKFVRDYMHADLIFSKVFRHNKELILIGWKPPPVGWVKLNSDGACKHDGSAGCGRIIRGSDGEWLGGFAKNLGICSAYVAEQWGVYAGFRLARRLGFKAVELNVDSLLVANVLNSNQCSSRALVAKIRSLIAMDWEVVVKHSYREANRCADALASYGATLEDGFCFYETCPAHLSQLLVADVMGISVPRLVIV
ncbi:ribonuclease H [Trifolium pratense]|uniref:Ribonuclease H n=1 Tax=Trifolium pratense TaxID=57577 RepID=A0A2K3P4L0_TRIPR|nr:ribonuclease H [Trifolium pratense]